MQLTLLKPPSRWRRGYWIRDRERERESLKEGGRANHMKGVPCESVETTLTRTTRVKGPPLVSWASTSSPGATSESVAQSALQNAPGMPSWGRARGFLHIDVAGWLSRQSASTSTQSGRQADITPVQLPVDSNAVTGIPQHAVTVLVLRVVVRSNPPSGWGCAASAMTSRLA